MKLISNPPFLFEIKAGTHCNRNKKRRERYNLCRTPKVIQDNIFLAQKSNVHTSKTTILLCFLLMFKLERCYKPDIFLRQAHIGSLRVK